MPSVQFGGGSFVVTSASGGEALLVTSATEQDVVDLVCVEVPSGLLAPRAECRDNTGC